MLHIIPVTSISKYGWLEGTGQDSKKSGTVKLYVRSVPREISLHHSELSCEYSGKNSEVPWNSLEKWYSKRKQDKWVMTKCAPKKKKQDCYNYIVRYVIFGTSIVSGLGQHSYKWASPKLIQGGIFFFLASGLRFGQEKCCTWLAQGDTYSPIFISN